MNGRRPVYSVDVLPVDMQLWTEPSAKRSPTELAEAFDSRANAAITTTLVNLGYDVGASIGWDGSYVDSGGHAEHAMSEAAVAATAYSLSGYGRAVRSASDSQALSPYLPAQLGNRTGSDATLYVGGWAYVGHDHHEGTGSKVAKGILIGALIVVVIAVAVIGIKKGGGGVARAAGGAGKAVARVAGGAARVAGRAGSTLARVMARSVDNFAEGMARSADALGRTHTHIEIYGGRPDYYEEPASPKRGRSQTYLEMTLVDNASGRTLWHARQRFRASAANSGHVVEMVHRMMATFPSSPR